MAHDLDFATLPDIAFGHAFFQLDDEVVRDIARLGRVSARAKNAVRFAYWSGASGEMLRCTEGEAQQLREGCFRAALTEFVSIEEVQKLDYVEIGIVREPMKLNDTPSPLLHIFRELRNLEVHLRQSGLRKVPKDVLWGHINQPTEATPITISVWVLDGLTSQSFLALRNARYYRQDQID